MTSITHFKLWAMCIGLVASSAAFPGGGTQTSGQADVKVATAAPSTATAAGSWHTRQGLYFKRNWGVDIIGVKPVASGYMLAFRYRIIDPDKARMLNDRKSKAYVIDEATGTRLAVPALENIGELRSGSTPETDRIYFMIFGNPGKLVKSGSRISVVAGNFHIDGLIVD